jgi:hypothetical protein
MMALSKIDPAGLDIGQIGGRRNLIINGAQTVDQRFSGSSELKGSGAKYHTDRFVVFSQAASKLTAQQVSESPAGFKNSLQLTVTNAVSLGAGDQYMLQQRLEGQNVSHLSFGTSNAVTVTLSFYVRSSIAGTHSGVLVNGSENRNYPFTYTISAANTWERISVTIAGDTSGTWVTTNAVGMWVKWNLGTGSTYLGTAGAWSGSSYLSGATGSVQLIETASATFYITGVQLEVGTVATPFEHRSFDEELFSCYRYYYKIIPGAADKYFPFIMHSYSGTNALGVGMYPVEMRTTPTAIEISSATDFKLNKPAAYNIVTTSFTYGNSTNPFSYNVVATVSSGLTSHDTNFVRTTGSDSFLAWSAEL